jgi:hypothetical protein
MSTRRTQRPAGTMPAADIDALYGLEPVFEPGERGGGDGEAPGTQFERICCPFCGEQFETQVDLSAGSSSYIEDCQVCCQPIEMQLEVEDDGTLKSLSARRGD